MRKLVNPGFPLHGIVDFQVTWDTRFLIYGGHCALGLSLLDEELQDQMGFIQEKVASGDDIWVRYEIEWGPR